MHVEWVKYHASLSPRNFEGHSKLFLTIFYSRGEGGGGGEAGTDRVGWRARGRAELKRVEGGTLTLIKPFLYS